MVTVPCYGESLPQIIKTQVSILENMDFIKNSARFQENDNGLALQASIQNLQLVIVYIFDGLYDYDKGKPIMDLTVRDWIGEADDIFRKSNVIRDLSDGEQHARLSENSSVGQQSDWLVCAGMTEWEYNSQNVKTRMVNKKLVKGDVIPFSIVTIVKRKNNGKANSHHWMFNGICKNLSWPNTERLGLDVNSSTEDEMICLKNDPLLFLTDCSTIFDPSCLCTLAMELLSRKDLIAVTGRQRLARLGPSFHTCDSKEQTLFCCCGGKRHTTILSDVCWRCWVTYIFSPAPLQGFEFEATMVLNSAPYNIVEAMPVLPGPCQMFKWEVMDRFNVVDKYFELLVSDDAVYEYYEPKYTLGTPDPAALHVSAPSRPLSNYPLVSRPENYTFMQDSEALSRSSSFTSTNSSASRLGVIVNTLHSQGLDNVVANDGKNNPDVDDREIGVLALDREETVRTNALHHEHGDKNARKTLRKANMRLAEDRVLSFVVVFATGMGTKWVSGATFQYEPEIEFVKLLEQRLVTKLRCYTILYTIRRRRWINGTTACLFFNQFSPEARLIVDGGTVDRSSKRLVQFMWALNTYQFFCVLISPAVFGIALYTSLYHDKIIFGQWLGQMSTDYSAMSYNVTFNSTASYIINNVTYTNVTQHLLTISNTTESTSYWVNETPIQGFPLNWAGIMVVIYMAVYVIWVFISFDHFPKNRQEKDNFFNILCPLLVCLGFAVALPIYLALIIGMVNSISPILVIVCITMFGPVLIAASQSIKSAVLYCMFLPWFLIMLVYFLVFIPSYSFARFHDTSWGKGNDRADRAVEDAKAEQKSLVGKANRRLVLLNCLLAWFFCYMPSIVRVAFMFFLFLPVFLQILFSLLYLAISFLQQKLLVTQLTMRLERNNAIVEEVARSRRNSESINRSRLNSNV